MMTDGDVRDKIHELLCTKLNVDKTTLTLAKVLEAATWKGGREIAKTKRQGGGRELDSAIGIESITTADETS